MMRPVNFIKRFTQHPALLVSVVYGLIAGFWIIASDTVLAWLVRDPTNINRIQTYKGWFFVTVTMFLLYILVRRLFRHQMILAQRLQASEDFFRTTFEQTGIGLCRLDKTGRFLLVNQSLCHTLGYDDPAVLLTMNLSDLIHADCPVHSIEDLLTKTDLPATDTSSSQGHEVRLRHSTGHYRWYQIILRPITTETETGTFSGVIENIHETKIAQELIRENEQRFHTFFDSALIGMAIDSLDNRWLAVNHRFCEMVGYTTDELIERNWIDMTHPDDVDRNLTLFNQLLTGQQNSYTLEKRFIHKDGSIIHTMLSANAIRNPDGTLNHLVTLIEDITERKKVEKNLADSEKQYQRLIEQSPMPIVFHQAGEIVYLNNMAVRTLAGISKDEFIGQPLLDFIPPEDHDAITARIQRIYAAQEAVPHIEQQIIRLDGQVIDVDVMGTSTTYMDKPSAQVIFQDITERKRDEKSLRRYAARLAALREIDQAILKAHSPEEIAASTLKHIPELLPCQYTGVLAYDFPANKAVILATHSATDKPLTMPPSIPLEDMELLDQLWDGETYCITDITTISSPPPAFDHLKRQGIISYVVIPLLVQGKLLGALYITRATPGYFTSDEMAVSRDLGDLLAVAIHQANLYTQIQQYALTLEQNVADRTRELLDANNRLQELDHLKSKFVSDVSHELRAPITNLGMYLHLLTNSPPEKRADYLAILKLQVERLTNLVESILDLTRLELGTRQPTMRAVDLNLLIDQIITAHTPRIEAAGVTLHVATDTDLPFVWGEQNQLSQVIANLLGNAINYTPAGQITVRTYSATDQPNIYFQVEDTGLGIPAEELPHIFERFYRGEQPSTLDIPGTGLGLGIVQEIVRLHQGDITVESTLGAGSTFTVSLPAVPKQENQAHE